MVTRLGHASGKERSLSGWLLKRAGLNVNSVLHCTARTIITRPQMQSNPPRVTLPRTRPCGIVANPESVPTGPTAIEDPKLFRPPAAQQFPNGRAQRTAAARARLIGDETPSQRHTQRQTAWAAQPSPPFVRRFPKERKWPNRESGLPASCQFAAHLLPLTRALGPLIPVSRSMHPPP